MDFVDEAINIMTALRLGHITDVELKIMPRLELFQFDSHLRADAWYDENEDAIYFAYPPMDSKNLVQRMLHEFAHRMWSLYMPRKAWKIWRKHYKVRKENGGPFVSVYSGKNEEEDFAEIFARWALKRLPVMNESYYEELISQVSPFFPYRS